MAYTPPRIHRFPSSLPPISAEGDAHTVDHHERYQAMLSSLRSLPPNSFLPPPPTELQVGSESAAEQIIHEVREGTRLETQDGSASLEIIHTPGHTVDSICLVLQPRPTEVALPSNLVSIGQPEPTKTAGTSASVKASPVLFTADTVLGHGTAVFEDLSTYMSSLEKLLSLARGKSSSTLTFDNIYPGHGPVIDDGEDLIATYIEHRRVREAQIVEVLSKHSRSNKAPSTHSKESNGLSDAPVKGDSSLSIWEIVSVIYVNYRKSLWLPAAHSVGLHLAKLEKDGCARCLGGEGIEQRWAFVSSL